ncbi:MAG: phosphatidylserine/phosphatidylglycerophosphate/cardiolipin synthase family protein [Candidatus Sericytochromatia bacterium]|nr:phosphatidylserine/phosphatidylglycerophosphate/cardiolipin synthase family protein [Candidatus Sericytochromatia bacterium]
MPRTTRQVLSLALICGLLLAGCSHPSSPHRSLAPQAGGSPTGEMEAQRAALGELQGVLAGPPVTVAQSGLSQATFEGLDQDRDGRLSRGEKLQVFQDVWRSMSAIAAARRPVEGVESRPLPLAPGDYQVAHPLAFAPTQADVFIDAGQILPAVFQTIQQAQKSVWMDLFLLGGNEGRKLAELLVNKGREGLDIRILHDPGYGLAGSAHQQIVPVVRYLLANGISVKSYPIGYLPRRAGHPLANRFQIDHNKFVIVDQRVAMLGTMNLIDLGVMNHDVYLRVTGAAAAELAGIHAATWGLRGSLPPTFPAEPTPKPSKTPKTPSFFGLLDVPANVSNGQARVTKTDIDIQDTKKVLIEAIQGAKRSVHVAIFEFGDVEVAQALVAAYKRNVDVRVLADKNANYHKYLDAFKSLKLYGTPNLLTANILRDAGVPIKWYVPQVEDQELHMKLALIDGERALVGSTNYTYQAFRTFRETNLDLLSPSVSSELEAMFERDWTQRGTPVVKPDFYERCIIAAVRAFDRFHLSWW